jgi:hypothetical protein
VLAALYQRKIQEIKAARWQFAEQGTLPEPASLGLFLKP